MKRLFLMLIITIVIAFIAFISPKGQYYSSVNHTKTASMLQDTAKIKLEKTSFNDMAVLFVHDTASTTEAIGSVFSKDYGELMQFAHMNNLTPVKFIGWYYTMQPPWIMDIAIEVNQLPKQTSGRIQAKMEIGGEVLIAHVWGPYNQVGQAYRQMQTWLKHNNRTTRENPFEVYINDPATVVNPSDIQTDIYQPLE